MADEGEEAVVGEVGDAVAAVVVAVVVAVVAAHPLEQGQSFPPCVNVLNQLTNPN